MIGPITKNAERSTKQYSLARTPAVPGPIEILSEIEGKKGRIMKKTGEKGRKRRKIELKLKKQTQFADG